MCPREYFIAVDDAPVEPGPCVDSADPVLALQRPVPSEIRLVNKARCQRLLQVPLIQLIVQNESR